MKIRSITYFDNSRWPPEPAFLRRAEQFALAARPAFEDTGFEVQTLHLAAPPFPRVLPDSRPQTGRDFARALEDALRLDKPLTARLMPVPGKTGGDPTGFDFAFFANSRVMALDAAPLRGHLAGSGAFSVAPRKTGR